MKQLIYPSRGLFMSAKWRYLFVIAFFVFSFCQTVSAELAAVGPTNTTNNFPQWYQDENGLTLELCLNSGNCVFDPVVNTSFSAQIGFGERASYWSASATLLGAGAKGDLNMAIVASFSGSTTGAIPADGEQIVFFEITVGPITGLTAGNAYRVVHPYGVIEDLVADAFGVIPVQRQNIGCAIALPSATPPVPCDFTSVLRSPVGPFLQWDTSLPIPLIGFIGNPSIAHTVVGSPFGTNIFQIEGPNAGGTGVNFKQTNLFKIQGKIFTGIGPTIPPAPLAIDRSTYTRPLPPQIEVIATSSPSATLTATLTGSPFPVAMTPDGNGKFLARIFNPVPFPSSVIVTATDTGKRDTAVTSDLVDIVTITLAEFNPVVNTLTIRASSSDASVPPTLTAIGFGNLVAGSLVVLGVAVPPAQVTVVSSAGGIATALVSVIAKPLAVNNTALTLRTTAVVINVLSNDIAFPVGIGSLAPATVTVVTPPAKGTTSVNTATGEVTYTPTPASFTQPVQKDTFNYTVKDSFGQESNVASVTVTVAEAEVLTVTKAQFTTRTKVWQITGKSKTSAATTGKPLPGNKITVYLGPDTTGPVIGTATVNAFGGWTFTKFNSPVNPGAATQVTAGSALGTVVTFSPIIIR